MLGGFGRETVTEGFPLIRFLLDDPVYRDRYVALLAENTSTMLEPEGLIARIRSHAGVIAPVATKDMSRDEYDAAVQAIVAYVEQSATELQAFLANRR